MPGIWLSDEEAQQTAGTIWAQQVQQHALAGQAWASQQLTRLQQQAAQQVAALAPSPVVAAPPPSAPTPTPAPVQTPPPTPPPPPPPVPIGGTPVATPTPPVPGDLTAGIAPALTPAPQPPPTVPMPTATPSMADVGQTWAQQQIANLLNPSAQTPQPSTPVATPQPVSGLAPPAPAAALPEPQQAQGGPPTAPPDRSMSFQDYARAAAQRAGIDPNVFTAQIQQESGFNPNAKSPAGAIGIAQFMPATAAGVGVDPTDPYAALDAAAKEDAKRLQQYGGDWAKTLASYNAGASAVEQYGGIPPYAETQGYVKTILGNAQRAADAAGTTISGAVQGAQNLVSAGVQAVNTTAQAAQAAVARAQPVQAQRQFEQEAGLSAGDAYTACGPVAAAAFAATYGRNPSPTEAIALAKQVGWNPQAGMAGAQSEVKLLNAMGIDAHMTNGVDWANVGRDASGGNPVIIDTPGHYYYVDGYNQQTGQLHVGASGLALKGGSEWMTPDQINAMPQSGGSARAAIFADHPLAQSDGLAQSTAASKPTSGQTVMGGLQDAAGNALANAPLPFIGQSANQLGDLLNLNQQQLQQGRDLVGSILTPDPNAPAPLRAKADSILQSVQDVGGQASQASQNLLQQGQQLLQGAQQAPQTVSDLLNQNALFSQGIPNIGGNLLEGAGNLLGQGQQALNPGSPLANALGNAINGPSAASATTPLQRAGQWLTSTGQDVLSGDQIIGAPGASNVIGGGLQLAGGVLSAPPIDQQSAQQMVMGMAGNRAGGIGQDLLANPVAQDIGRNILGPMLGLPNTPVGGLNDVANALNPAVTPQAPLGRAADWLSQQNVPFLSGAAGVAAPTLDQGGALDATYVADSLVQKYGTSDSSQYSPEDQQRLAQARMAIGGAVSPLNILQAGRIGALAGGIPTLVHIALNTPVQTALKLANDVPASVLTGHPEASAAELYGAMQGLRSWALTAASTLRAPGPLASSMGGGAGPQALETGLTGAVRLHPVLQDLANQMATHMDLWRSAATSATDAGLARFSPAWRAEVARLIASPTADMTASAKAAGDTAALRGPMGTTGQALADAINKAPILRFMLPIFNVGYHVATQGLERSPLGAAGTAWDVARGAAGQGPYGGAAGFAGRGAADAVTPLAQRIRNNLIGLGLAYEAYNLASQGLVTGAGPSDPKEQAALRETGWQPDSSLINGRYFDNHLLGPVGWALGQGANMYEATHSPAEGGTLKPIETPQGLRAPGTLDVLGDFVSREGRYFNNETFLSSLGSALNAIGSGAQQGKVVTSELGNVVQSLIPQGALLANAASAVDPYVRQARGSNPVEQFQQQLATRVPGLRESVAARMTATGTPEPNPQQGAGLLLPRSRPVNADPILVSMAQAGVTPSATPISVPYGPMSEVRLTAQEQQAWEQYRGQVLQQGLSSLVQSPQWQRIPANGQRAALEQVNSLASDAAGKMVLRDIAGAGQSRMLPTGALAPAYSYAPIGLGDPLIQARNQAQHAALMQALLSGQSGTQAIMAANAAAAGAV